ncbi:hypothetical protein KJ840_03160 [Patescibacteria group bacterium]|nr:hypothetical protein [Patescibacteria group bacterium]
MKINFLTVFLFSILLFTAIFILPDFALAITAPTVSFVGGDNSQGGGFYDPYDSLIVFKISTAEPRFDYFEMQYSDNGQSWSDIAADCEEISGPSNLSCYWSTTGIFALKLWFRARSIHNEASSQSQFYDTSNLSLSHRNLVNYTTNFFTESFDTAEFESEMTTANWDINIGRKLLELNSDEPPLPPYQDYGLALSTNLLAGDQSSDAIVTGVIVQPVQVIGAGQSVDYKVSDDGINWQSISFPAGQIVPAAQEFDFENPAGHQLFWRAELSTNNNQKTPRVYQVRINWKENHTPQACFTVEPTSNFLDPRQQYFFNASCSGDYEDSLTEMKYRWYCEDAEHPFDTGFQTGGYTHTEQFNSTSTFVINLEVEDTLGAQDQYQSSINEESLAGGIYGWMWGAVGYGSSKVGAGWTSLNCDNVYDGTSINFCGYIDYGLQMDEQYIWGWAWNSYWGWLCFGATCDYELYGYPPRETTEARVIYSRSDGTVNGWGRFVNAAAISQEAGGWLQLRGLLESSEPWCGGEEVDLCTHLNFEERTMEGFAWSAWTDPQYPGEKLGPGWQSFEYAYINLPWLETLYGTMYSQTGGGEGSNVAPPAGEFTASYCILSGGDIVNYESGIGCSQEGYTQIAFPSANNQYRNILGIIDFDRILDGDEYPQILSSSDDVDGILPNVLGGKVYYFTNEELTDYIINEPFIIFNARNVDSSGAGTVVIDGNLRINSDFYYENVAVTSQIENLASIAWIVKGDVIIDPNVANIVGAFIVLGQEGIIESGQFKTGYDFNDPKKLLVKGLVMAKGMVFDRYYRVAGASSEQIIYDGRALVNTPPGLEDVARALPLWRETFATTQIEE